MDILRRMGLLASISQEDKERLDRYVCDIILVVVAGLWWWQCCVSGFLSVALADSRFISTQPKASRVMYRQNVRAENVVGLSQDCLTV